MNALTFNSVIKPTSYCKPVNNSECFDETQGKICQNYKKTFLEAIPYNLQAKFSPSASSVVNCMEKGIFSEEKRFNLDRPDCYKQN